jgi:L-seryl-tRNA(Ser) seleniumtransferase
MLHASAGVLSGKADTLAAGLSEINHITCTVEDGEGFSGGGALPQETLPTRIVTVKSSSLTVDQLAEALRKCAVPVIGRIQNDAFTMDVRTLIDGDAEVIIEAFRDLHA